MAKRKTNSNTIDESDYEGFWSSEEEDSTEKNTDEEDNFSDISSSSDEDEIGPVQIPDPIDVPWTFSGIPRPAFPFQGDSGIKLDNLNKDNPIQLFECFFTNELINKIVVETNRYAEQYLNDNKETIKNQSRVKKWTATNANEIRTLLALFIIQGICIKPEYKLYFTKRESIETPFFSRIISEKRFHLLLKFLHFVNNKEFDANSPNRRLFKIQPILDYLKEKFMSIYVPNQKISIDESLIGWKGRLAWKQYIPSKRKRFGMKIFVLCESETGYVYNFFIYTGSSTQYGNSIYPDEPVSSRVVLELSHSLLNKGYCLYLDNYYTSPDLTDKLIRRRTDCVGTMRVNRKGIPTEIKSKKLQKGNHIAMYRRKQMIMKWKDKRDIVMTSTIHDDSKTLVKGKGGLMVEKPTVVLDYNSKMGGVDLADNMLHFYTSARCRLKKYYMKIFRHFLDVATLNSFILYKKLGGQKNRLNFLLDLGEQMVEQYATEREVCGRRPKIPRPSRLLERHFPDLIPPTTKEKPTKRCAVCSENGKRKESRY